MMKQIRSWWEKDMRAYRRAHSLGTFRDAFTQRGYPIELFSDAAIEEALPAMFAAVADASVRIAQAQHSDEVKR